MRFQALMPDILHWLGIKKIDRMLSMSNMKHDAIVAQGIKILERVPIPEGKPCRRAIIPSYSDGLGGC
jgi:GTP cyclohydrolase II